MKIHRRHQVAAAGLVYLTLFSCYGVGVNRNNRTYLTLRNSVSNTREQHIAIIQNIPTDLDFPDDDRVAFHKLTSNQHEKIRFLAEYLSFQGDTTISNRFLTNIYGRAVHRFDILTGKTKVPIEVDALYSMTVLLFDQSVVIAPVLVSTTTGKSINFNRKDIDEVYRIYRKWFKKQKKKKNKFKDLTWPLKGSQFRWLGEEVFQDMESMLRKSL